MTMSLRVHDPRTPPPDERWNRRHEKSAAHQLDGQTCRYGRPFLRRHCSQRARCDRRERQSGVDLFRQFFRQLGQHSATDGDRKDGRSGGKSLLRVRKWQRATERELPPTGLGARWSEVQILSPDHFPCYDKENRLSWPGSWRQFFSGRKPGAPIRRVPDRGTRIRCHHGESGHSRRRTVGPVPPLTTILTTISGQTSAFPDQGIPSPWPQRAAHSPPLRPHRSKPGSRRQCPRCPCRG